MIYMYMYSFVEDLLVAVSKTESEYDKYTYCLHTLLPGCL